MTTATITRKRRNTEAQRFSSNRHGKGRNQDHPPITRDEWITILQVCARELGRTPGHDAFDKWLGYHASQTCMKVVGDGKWSLACAAAGLKPNPRHANPRFGGARYTAEDCCQAVQRIAAEVGRRPTYEEYETLRRQDEPTGPCLRRRHEVSAIREDAAHDWGWRAVLDCYLGVLPEVM